MTNENAIRWLKDLLKSDLPMEQYQTAIEKGIEALEPSGDLISREETLTAFADYVGSGMSMNDYEALWDIVAKMPSVKQETKTGHCKDCKYFEYDSVAKVDGIPLIVAHEICSRWGDGCKTKEDGYCFLYEPRERSGEE